MKCACIRFRWQWRAAMSLLALACLTFASSGARGEPEPDGVVTGAGAVTLKRQPNILRMQVTLTAQGKDMNEAIGKLKEVENSANGKLAAAGAASGGIEIGDPR